MRAPEMQLDGFAQRTEEDEVVAGRGLFSPGWSDNPRQEHMTKTFVEVMTTIAARYMQNGAFIRGHEASEEAISATDINGLPMLSAEDILLQSAIINFFVDFETKNKLQKNADSVRRK
eukprot:IDg2133t1